MLAIDKNKAVKKELKRFKEALKGMENYLGRMARGVDEIHHCGYVATAPQEVTQTVAMQMGQDGKERDFKMVFRFELAGSRVGKVTYCPLYGHDGAPDDLANVTVEQTAIVEWFLVRKVYFLLTEELQKVVNRHNESLDQLRKELEAFSNWSESVNAPECEPECPVTA